MPDTRELKSANNKLMTAVTGQAWANSWIICEKVHSLCKIHPLKISWNPQTTPCTKTTMAKNRYPPIPDKRTQIYSSYGLLLLWLEVYQLHRTTLTDIITVMKDIFSPHGIPEELVSDNGTQYKSNLFHKFVTTWGIQHTTSSPP